MNPLINTPNAEVDNAYFSYFEKQCRLARQNDDVKSPSCTQSTICDIVHQLKAGKSREEIRQRLVLKIYEGQSDLEQIKHLENAIDLATRLWLMVNVGYVCRGVTSQTVITWESGGLQHLLNMHFKHELILTDSIKLEKTFNARSIELIANVNIQWTPNLIDHLRFTEDGKRPILNIFYHTSFLNRHLNK